MLPGLLSIMLLLRFGAPPLAPWLRMVAGNSGDSIANRARRDESLEEAGTGETGTGRRTEWIGGRDRCPDFLALVWAEVRVADCEWGV